MPYATLSFHLHKQNYLTARFRSRRTGGMASSRHNSDELPPPYSSVVHDAYMQGFLHPPSYVRVAVFTDDTAGYETTANSSSESRLNETEQQVRFALLPIGNVMASFYASNTNTSAHSSQTDVRSHQNCPPSEYTPDVAPSPPQTDEDYIVIAKRIMAATQSGDSSPAVRFTESNRALAATQSSDSSTAVRFTVSPPNGNNISISNRVSDNSDSSGEDDECCVTLLCWICRSGIPNCGAMFLIVGIIFMFVVGFDHAMEAILG